MPSDISRKLFDPKKHYSGVQMQQGRVQLDADWNEQLDIGQYRTFTESIDVIGASGVPKNVNNGNSFKITVPNLNDIRIDFGRMYVGGLLCELDKAVTYGTQPHYPEPDKGYFTANPASPLSPASPFSPASPLSPLGGSLKKGAYIAYIDAWQREITYLDDAHIQEVALGGPDTTTRLQTVWQVKLKAVADLNIQCDTPVVLEAPTTGKLTVQTKKSAPTDNPCVLPPTAGYRRVENQLYRIEIHKGGTLADTFFKWSRDNATVETSVVKPANGSVLTVQSIGKDEVLSFEMANWVELVDEASTLNNMPQNLLQITSPPIHDTREITVNTSAIPNGSKMPLKLRRWDQSGLTATENGVKATAGWIELEDGIQVQFLPGTYKAGDYWLVPARTKTGDVEWPLIPGTNMPQPQAPVGVPHAFCKLGILKIDANNAISVEDCRPLFAPLTEIKESDCACTFTVKPEPGWEKVFDKIKKGQDAHICFQVGVYPLTNPKEITDKGHIKLSGAGKGTKIIAKSQEKGLIFNNCKTVLVRDLYVETGLTGHHKKGDNKDINPITSDLNGGLNMLNCENVHVDSVSFKNGTGRLRAATCLTIRNDNIQNKIKPNTTRVLNCDFQIGHLQQGLLLVNAVEAIIENNILKTYPRPATYTFAHQIKNDHVLLSELRRTFFDNIRFSTAANLSVLGTRNVEISKNDAHIALKTTGRLKAASEKMINDAPAEVFLKESNFRNHLNKNFNKLLTDVQYRKKYPAFNAYIKLLASQTEAIATQAITVGGETAGQIKIINNVISDTLQGIHVGVSHHAARNIHDHCQQITISNNSIKITLPPYVSKLGRHGIFVGNCKDLLIENNNITLNRLPESDYIYIDGIRVFGILGDRLMIVKNHVSSLDENPRHSFDFGIRVNPIIPINEKRQQWVVMWNVAPSKQATLALLNGVDRHHPTNIPLP
jgi:hypothetical protein